MKVFKFFSLLGFGLLFSYFFQTKQSLNKKDLLKEISSVVRVHKDFPKKGIVFQDVLTVFEHPEILEKVVLHLEERYKNKVDVVVGLDARGFIIGGLLASRLKVPFIPVRKKGKLPGECYSVSYEKEYGQDQFEMSKLALKGSEKVLIVDDLIATGGSAFAAIDLIKKAGAIPSEFFAFSKVKGLKGVESLGLNSYILMEG